MKPYPFAPLNHFTVPFSLTEVLLSPRLIDLPQVLREACAPTSPLKEPGQLASGHVLRPRGLPQKSRTPEPPRRKLRWRPRSHTNCASCDDVAQHISPNLRTQCPEPYAPNLGH